MEMADFGFYEVDGGEDFSNIFDEPSQSSEGDDVQDTIEDAIKHKFGKSVGIGAGVCFGGMSCEQIATWCIDYFGCTECEVLEDGFGGAYARN